MNIGLLAALVLAGGGVFRIPPAAVPAAAPKPAATLAATTPAAGGPGAAPDLKTITGEVQRRYDAATDFRARFSQTLTSAALGRKTISSGEVAFKKPGRMRWDYQKPDKSTYVTDGGVLWLYEPDDGQAFKQELKSSQLPAALAFLTGKGELANEFEISFGPQSPYGVGGDYVLSLSPRQPQPQVKSILFIVDPRTFDVRESVITDSQGNVNDVVFADIKVNTRVPEATFHFSPPPGTRVIDTAKLGH
jgi:outer membrane lipoprotein carrier protein